MDKHCDACQFLQQPVHQILTTEYWAVGIGNNQAYFGRAYVTLRQHKGSLSELDEVEWQDFRALVRRLEGAYKEVYGAEPLNWGCLMNNAYQVDPPHPHVHWHIYPRYRHPHRLDGVAYDDPLFGHHYDNKAERLVSDEVVEQIAEPLRASLVKAAGPAG